MNYVVAIREFFDLPPVIAVGCSRCKNGTMLRLNLAMLKNLYERSAYAVIMITFN